jgi:hypothetical protein
MDDRGTSGGSGGLWSRKLATCRIVRDFADCHGGVSRSLGRPALTRAFVASGDSPSGRSSRIVCAACMSASTTGTATRLPRVRRSSFRRWAAGCRRRWPAAPGPSRILRTRAGTPSARTRARTRPRPRRRARPPSRGWTRRATAPSARRRANASSNRSKASAEMSAPLAKAKRTPVTCLGGLHVAPIAAPTSRALEAAEPKSRAVIKGAIVVAASASRPRWQEGRVPPPPLRAPSPSTPGARNRELVQPHAASVPPPGTTRIGQTASVTGQSRGAWRGPPPSRGRSGR